MSERKKRLKNHIKAAREWLCRAEASLDKDNSIQGDLNLMLAQAELQRAKESGQNQYKKKIRWFVRLAPPIAAVCLVFIGIQFWPHVFATRVSSPPVKTVAEEPAKASGALPAVVSEINTGVVSVPAAGRKTVLVVDDAVPMTEKEKSVQLVPVKEENDTTVSTQGPEKPQVPTVDMQKLMRAAGKTLRAQ